MRQKANDHLDFYKRSSNIHAIGLYRSLVKHCRGYFSTANLRTVLQWESSLKNALHHTSEYRKQTQHLISRYITITPTNATRQTRPIKKLQRPKRNIHQTVLPFSHHTDNPRPPSYKKKRLPIRSMQQTVLHFPPLSMNTVKYHIMLCQIDQIRHLTSYQG